MPGGELGAEARQPGVGAAGSTAAAVAERSLPGNAAGLAVAELQVDDKPGVTLVDALLRLHRSKSAVGHLLECSEPRPPAVAAADGD